MTDTPLETDCSSVDQLQREQADFLLLDCREADEYATAHIAGGNYCR